MGLAASQSAYLALTSRKSDLELQSQVINSRRIQLSYKTAEIARAYTEAMNNKIITMSVQSESGTNGTITKAWTELKFDNLLEGGYMLIGSGGTALQPAPYVQNGDAETTSTHSVTGTGGTQEWDEADIKALLDNPDTAGAFVKTQEGKYKLANTISDEVYQALKKASAEVASEVKTEETDEKTGDTTDEETDEKTGDATSTLANTILGYFEATANTSTKGNWKVNPDYKGLDIQSLLVSGQAQIVTKAFFDELCNKGGYQYGTGIQTSSYKEILDEWNKNNSASVVDWRSDQTSTFKQRQYTEDDEEAIAAYEAANAEIQAQDKILEMEEKNIETQHKAVETELENIKKVIQKNIEETFKIFS